MPAGYRRFRPCRPSFTASCRTAQVLRHPQLADLEKGGGGGAWARAHEPLSEEGAAGSKVHREMVGEAAAGYRSTRDRDNMVVDGSFSRLQGLADG